MVKIQKITYVAGQYSQFKLLDRSKLFLETLPEYVRIKRIVLGFIPTTTIWEFKFPFYIRTVGEVWEFAKEILDLVLQSIENCKTIDELERKLKDETMVLLNEYVRSNEEKAYQTGIEKLGNFAAMKYIASSPKLRDALAISGDVMEIIGDYGKVLEDLSQEREEGNFFHPISKLPHPKEKIENALDMALKIVQDGGVIEHLKIVRTALKTFIPDDEVAQANQKFMSKENGRN